MGGFPKKRDKNKIVIKNLLKFVYNSDVMFKITNFVT